MCTMNVELPMRAVAAMPSPSGAGVPPVSSPSVVPLVPAGVRSVRVHSREVRTCFSETSMPAQMGTLPPLRKIDTTGTPPVCGLGCEVCGLEFGVSWCVDRLPSGGLNVCLLRSGVGLCVECSVVQWVRG